MKKIVYTRPDGGISVIKPVFNTIPVREQITEEQALARARKDIPKDATNVMEVESLADLGFKDKTFRNAWTRGGVDMSKAREVHKDRLRTLREPLLKAADVEFIRALETGKNVSEVVAKKQALRDVTADPRIAEAQTPEELNCVLPACLLPNP